jgi:hypothetical protein
MATNPKHHHQEENHDKNSGNDMNIRFVDFSREKGEPIKAVHNEG